jgi:hypothetical protein
MGLETQMSGVKLVDLSAISRIEIKKKVGVIVLCAAYRIVIQGPDLSSASNLQYLLPF